MSLRPIVVATSVRFVSSRRQSRNAAEETMNPHNCAYKICPRNVILISTADIEVYSVFGLSVFLNIMVFSQAVSEP